MPETIIQTPTPAGVSASLDSLGSAVGSILYRGVSRWEILPPGPAGHILVTHGPGAAPTWEPPPP